MTLSHAVPAPAVLDALRAAVLSEDGLTLTLAGQLDKATYQATAKVIEVYGGKWSRKAKAHEFKADFRPQLAGLLDGGKLAKKNPLAFFATPAPLVAALLDLLPADLSGVRVLEPSAGEGALAGALRSAGAAVDVLELDDTRHAGLVAQGFTSVGRDFLAFTPAAPYAAVVMNPPFAVEGDALAYITHIERAYACLAPGGTLVAIVPNGFVSRTDKRCAAFRALVTECGEYSPNEAGAFQSSGTLVQTVTICMRKPDAPAAAACLQCGLPAEGERCAACEADFQEWAEMCDGLRFNAAEYEAAEHQELCGL